MLGNAGTVYEGIDFIVRVFFRQMAHLIFCNVYCVMSRDAICFFIRTTTGLRVESYGTGTQVR